MRCLSIAVHAVLAGTLGFGAAQALASPPSEPATNTCVAAVCSAGCILKGYDRGVCRDGRCICYRLE